MTNLESYPPEFRQKQNDFDYSDNGSVKELQESSSDAVPWIDLESIHMEEEKLGEACKDWGLFRLVNHGIPETLMNQLHSQTRNLFSLSFETKQKLFTDYKAVSYFWGTPALTPSGDALITRRGAPQNINWVEGFNVFLGQLPENDPFQSHQDSLFDSFRDLLEEYGKHMGRVARTVFEGIVKSLGLDSAKQKSEMLYLSESTGLLRIYRYPKLSKANNEEALGMEVHTDSSVLSILSQDQVGGLEAFKDQKWLLVQPIPNSLIINLGDMMQAISNDEYTSVKHRVKVCKNEERLSIGYFVFPGEGSVIRSSMYKPFTYTDFQAQVQHDVKTLGFKLGLERFKIQGS